MARMIRMIKAINNTVIQTRELNNRTEVEKAPIHKEEIINIYEEHLQITSPTYSEDIKEVMQKENIEENNLNAKIIETMSKSGVNITKSSLNIIVNQLQKEHLFNLFQEGYDIQELTVGIIAEEIIKTTVSTKLEDKEIKDNIDKDITKALVEAGLPITNKNLEILEQYKDKIEDIMENSDVTILNMIRHKSDITINNLYASKHRGEPKDKGEIPTDEQIIAVLNMNGIKATQENIKAAASLVKGNVEITRENVKSYINLKDLISKIYSTELVNKAAKEMKKGGNPGDLNINPELDHKVLDLGYDEVNQMVEDIMEDIEQIDERIIEDTYKKGKPITIHSLQKTLHENIEKVLGGNNDKIVIEVEHEVEPEKVSTTKRQLEEIRLSLTLEAALKLSSKLDIQTTELTKLVEELKIIEIEHIEEVLKNTGTPVTEENVGYMKQTSERIYSISQNKELAMVQVVENEAEFTLEGMDQAIKLKHAQDSYEEAATKPEKHFGEVIAKVEGQIEHILKMNEIEPTDSNIKAAKALVQNNIDISAEAVETAKIVLLKIETVLYELRPAVVAGILKEGIRLDTMPIDNLIEHIRGMQQDRQIDPKQKIAEGILELDKSNQLNPTEREGLVAVYRMLSTITKNETAAIGFLLDNNKEPTLGNLFEASKYIKQVGSKTGKMDLTVDDDLGIREGELPSNIRSLIGAATKLPVTAENMDKWLHTQNVIEQWLSRITPEELKTYIDMDKSLEELELKDGRLSSFETTRTTKQVEALEKVSPHTLTFLKEHHIPATIANIYWTDKMIKNPYLLGDMLKDYEKLTGEEIESSINKTSHKQNIEEILEQLEKELDGQSPKWLSAPQSAQAYSIGKDLEQMLSTQRQISKSEGIYQIPIELHHGMSNLNLYVMKDKEQSNRVEKDELKAYMSIKTQNIGVIQVNMRISDKALAFEMIGETPEVTLGLQKGSKELKVAIEEIGYNVMQAKFSSGKVEASIMDRPKPSASLLKYRFEESKFEHII